jgi:hypothetical protein
MSKKDSTFRTIKTVDSIILRVYEDEQGKVKPHSFTEPAIQYPKDYGKSDEYCIFGINYSYDKWLELSRSVRRSHIEEDFSDD